MQLYIIYNIMHIIIGDVSSILNNCIAHVNRDAVINHT